MAVIDPMVKVTLPLRNFARTSALVPILVEGYAGTFNDILNIFDTFKLEVYQRISTFNFVAGIATPEMIYRLTMHPEIYRVHPDIEMFALGKKPIPFSLPLLPDFNPLTTISDHLVNNALRNTVDVVYDKVINKQVNEVLAFGDTLPSPLALLDNGLRPVADMLVKSDLLNLGMEESQDSENDSEALTAINPPIVKDTLPKLPLASPLDSKFTKAGFPTTYTRSLLGIDLAEEVGVTGKGVKIAVLDTGVDILAAQIPNEIDADNAMSYHPNIDENGHGTHVTSTAIGIGTINHRDIAVKGMATDTLPISIKCLGGGIGTGRTSDIIKGMEMAWLKGAKIVSMSLGGEHVSPSPMDETVTKLTREANMIFSIAAGNSGPEPRTIGCPGDCEEAITVGAVSPLDNKVTIFSSRGPTYDGRVKPDICSYGLDIYSATSMGSLLDTRGDNMPDGYATLSGTSMATPHLSGLLALIVQVMPDISSDQIKRIFAIESRQSKTNDLGWGIAKWQWFEKSLLRR